MDLLIQTALIFNFLCFGLSVSLIFILLYKRTRHLPVTFSWFSGLLYGLPFLPVMMMVFGFVFIGYGLISDDQILYSALFFTLNAMLAFAAGWMAVQKSITQTHLIINPLLKSGEIPINSITDYFFRTTGLVSVVTILYRTELKSTRKSFLLPARYVKLVDQILDQRMQNKVRTSTKETQLIKKIH